MVQPATHLGRGAWLRRLLDAAANRCVRQSRRDPRDSGEAEQSLYEQLLAAIDQGVPRLAQLHVQGTGWFSHLVFHADELTAMVTPLLRQALADLDAILATTDAVAPLLAVVVTHAAAGLPGLVPLLQARVPPPPAAAGAADEEADYGDSLLRAAEAGDSPVHVLPADTPACVAHELAVRVHRGDFPRGHLDVVSMPQAESPYVRDDGPPRLSFRGREHVLTDLAFTLGRDPTCDLVFESELYPHVSARHADIVFDRRAYLVRDRSRHGTLLNDRPVQQQAALHSGDWIRLGPRGPVLRFLGEPANR
ncbi:MAG: FHA domain-containing protein [Gemmataceae bacterium]